MCLVGTKVRQTNRRPSSTLKCSGYYSLLATEQPSPPPPSLHGSPCAIASVLVLVKRADMLGVVKGGAGSVQVMEVNRLASSKLKMARVKLGIPGGAM